MTALLHERSDVNEAIPRQESLLLDGGMHAADVAQSFDTIADMAALAKDDAELNDILLVPELYEDEGLVETALDRSVSDFDALTTFAKRETDLKINAFKMRGAFVACWQAKRRNPDLKIVAAASAGNHAQGVAYFVRWQNARTMRQYAQRQAEAVAAGEEFTEPLPELMEAHIFMKEKASDEKVGKTRNLGATVYKDGLEDLDDADAAGREFVDSKNATVEQAYFVPPYDHPDVMAGQSLQLVETVLQLRRQGCDPRLRPLRLYVAGGGFGMADGDALLMDRLVELGIVHPESCVVAVQMEGCDAMNRALQRVDAGYDPRVDLFKADDGTDTFDPSADGTAVRKPGVSNLPLTYYLRERKRLQVMTVSKQAVGASMQRAAVRGRTLEPAGALADAGRHADVASVAPYLIAGTFGRHEIHVVVESGGNRTEETADEFADSYVTDHRFTAARWGTEVLRCASSARNGEVGHQPARTPDARALARVLRRDMPLLAAA